MGKRTDKNSGVIGSNVCGFNTGNGGTGLSALMLYQYLGRSDSLSKYRVWLTISTSI